MPQVLYRKYRSKTFAEIIGQDPIKNALQQAVIENKPAHAYLFVGPRGTGKTSMARILAKALNCKNLAEGDPCNTCSSCQSINEGKFLDLIEIDAASNRGIDEVRDLKEKVGFLPVEGSTKVYIIDEVHMMTIEAFNALLKTLEEPPVNVVFILATTESHKLPQTIISRTQRYDFKLAGQDDVRTKLNFILDQEKIKFEDNALDMIISAGGGSFRDSESILEKVLSSYGYKKDGVINSEDVERILGFSSQELVERIIEACSQKELHRALECLQESYQKGNSMPQLLKQLLEFARNEMLTVINAGESIYSIGFLAKFIKEFSQAAEELPYALISTLPLEMAVVRITGFDNFEHSNVSKVSQKRKDYVEQIIDKPLIKENEKESSKNNNQKKSLVNAKQLSNEFIVDNWSKLLNGAKKYNHHLVAFLASAKFVEIDNDRLKLEVPFAFHKSRLESNQIQKAIKEITQEVFGKELSVICEVNSSLVDNKKKQRLTSSNNDLVEEVFGEFI